MTVKIAERIVFDAKCDRCGRKVTETRRADAEAFVAKHESWHVMADAIGPTLTGRVFVADRSYMMLHYAAEEACRQGYAYIAWNGQVLTSIDPDPGNPVCWVTDVPGNLATEAG